MVSSAIMAKKKRAKREGKGRGGPRPGAGRPGFGDRKAFTMRLPVHLVDGVDALATDLGVSRAHLIERVLMDLLTAGGRGEGTLFDSLHRDLQASIDEAVRNALREITTSPYVHLRHKGKGGGE